MSELARIRWFQTHDYEDRRAELKAGRKCELVDAVVSKAIPTADEVFVLLGDAGSQGEET